MAEVISLAQVEKKARRINEDYGLDIEIEHLNGAYRAVCNHGSKNLTPLLSKRMLYVALDLLEEGLNRYEARRRT